MEKEKCPNYRFYDPGKKYGPGVHDCTQRDMTIDDEMAYKLCECDWQNCSLYKHSPAAAHPRTSNAANANRQSSGGVGSLVVIVIIAAVVTKLLGIW